MISVLLVVFDGLRPDQIRPEVTPNLVRFAAMGARVPQARSVFPSETRVCTASVATGCHPRRHGLVANRMLHPLDQHRLIETGQADQLRALEQDTGAAAIMMPGLSDLLAAAGRDFAVFSSGSTGQTFILAPRAEALGQLVVSAHGASACSTAGQKLLARLDPPPADPAARAVWIADAWRTTQLPAPPAASVLWLCEPDTSAHYMGLDSPGQRRVLRDADAAFGRILDDWQAGQQRETLQIIVASDHGHVTGDAVFDLRAALADHAEFAGCTFTGGPSGGIGVPGAERERVMAIAAWLMHRDWIAHVFTADAVDLLPGALPHSAVMQDHRRTAPVLYTLRNSRADAGNGLPGTSLLDSAGGLVVGAGTHGGLNAHEMATVLMLAGSAVRPGVSSNWPAGLIDIAPTILALLGVPGAVSMDGRVLTETLADGADPADSRGPESWEAAGDHYAQRVARMRVGRHVWIDHGVREPIGAIASGREAAT
jgi:arylsulfatase A-like enzyme